MQATVLFAIASLVSLLVMQNALLALDLLGMTVDAALLEKGAKRIGVVTFVGHEFRDASNQPHAGICHHAISRFAASTRIPRADILHRHPYEP